MKKIIHCCLGILSALTLSNTWCCDENNIVRDYNGLVRVAQGKQKIQDTEDSRGSNVNWLCDELNSKKDISRLDLGNNSIGDSGAEILGEHFKNKDFLEKIEMLDLSCNDITSEGLKEFIPLLLRKDFRYLIICDNNGADSEHSIESLYQKLSALRDEKKHSQKGKLRKVIWVPKQCLEKEQWTKLRHLNPKSHQKYYEKYKD